MCHRIRPGDSSGRLPRGRSGDDMHPERGLSKGRGMAKHGLKIRVLVWPVIGDDFYPKSLLMRVRLEVAFV